MAKALECPACGARHRLDQLPGTPTFRCTRCGQKLMVPTVVRSGPPAAERFPAPPPRRRPPGPGGGPSNDPAGVTATLAPTAPPAARPTAALARDPAAVAAVEAPAVPDAARAPAAAAGVSRRPAPAPVRSRVAWYWRL